MQLEFHQLDRRGEQLRVQDPEQQKRLLASLASSGQQTPIVVVRGENQPDRYLVIDGYRRIAALQQLGQDTGKRRSGRCGKPRRCAGLLLALVET
jgi:hypothetical protein